MQISKILLPVDGSSYSNHATEHAVYLAKLSGAHIKAVTCYESARQYAGGLGIGRQGTQGKAEETG